MLSSLAPVGFRTVSSYDLETLFQPNRAEPVAELGCKHSLSISLHPHALHSRSLHLVADALGSDLTLELGEAEQDVQRQPPHGGGRIEGLRHRDKGDAVPVEDLNQFGKIHQ
jgi:hypothetical protein